jgi:hypothetical protein
MMSIPLKDVKIKLWKPSAIIVYDQASPSMSPVPIDGRLVDSAKTDAQGRFGFAPMESGSYQLTFDTAGFATRTIDLSAVKDTAMTVLMVRAGSHARVAGTVYAACSNLLDMPCILQPVSGCTVTVVKQPVTSFPEPVAWYPISIYQYSAVTNTQGQYSIDSVPLSVNGERVSVSAVVAGFIRKTVDTVIRNASTTTVNFSLEQSASGSRDTVYVTPAKPTTSDSITFLLKNWQHCCGTVYRNQTVSVSDTMIYLSYTYDDSACPYIRCLVAGSQVKFASQPIAAKTYSVYKVESRYCPPGQACILSITAPQFVGKVTVACVTGVMPVNTGATALPDKALTIANGCVWVTTAENSSVSIRAYELSGRLLAVVNGGRLPAGRHGFPIGQYSRNRALVLTLSVNCRPVMSKAVFVSH